jgi:hypothetical protein
VIIVALADLRKAMEQAEHELKLRRLVAVANGARFDAFVDCVTQTVCVHGVRNYLAQYLKAAETNGTPLQEATTYCLCYVTAYRRAYQLFV